MKPKVTIVIPVYNGSDYMVQAIDSALDQTYENIEVVVVNDGSVDRTEEIALSYGDKIRYFTKENGGVASALNLGIEKMEGDYFSYLPHDDRLHRDKIKAEMEAIMAGGDHMTIAWSGWNRLMEPEGKLEASLIPPWYSLKYFTKRIYPLLFGILNTVTVLIHKKYFDLYGTFDETLYTSQDYDMWYRTFKFHDTVYIDRPLVDYRIHPEQGTQSDPEFIKNCRELALKVLRTIDSSMVKSMGLSEYVFYYLLMKYYTEAGWNDCFSCAADRFSKAKEPESGENKRKVVDDSLHNDGRRLVLYGAGKNGKRLLNELKMYGIEAEAFCDSDANKTGTVIGGLPCISGEQLLERPTTVILTFDNPTEARRELESHRNVQVMDYAQVTDMLDEASPVRDMVLQHMREA